MTASRWLLKNGHVVDPRNRIDAVRDILIDGAKIAEVRAGLSKKHSELPSIDVEGRWVLPGPIDLHVHFREPGGSGETIASGARAAAKGGVTTVLAMPNTEPPIDTPERLRWALERGEKALVRVLQSAAVTVGQKGERLTELGALAESGAAAFSDDGKPVSDAVVMRRALEFARLFDRPIIDHCEDLSLTGEGVMNEGSTSARMGLGGIPNASEAANALRDIELVRLTGGRLHVAHVSCRETVEAVRRAKKDGLPVTAETCPHYFALTDEDIRGFDANFKMKPPLRARADLEALLEGLADGTIDAIATDHAPHSAERKREGFARAPFGVIGLETALPVSVTYLVQKGVLTRKQLAERLSAGPAAVLGLKDRGHLSPGAAADLTVVDPSAARTVEEPFESASSNSPFLGWKLKGFPVLTVVAGRVVMRDGELKEAESR
jgi:dihydroorotase